MASTSNTFRADFGRIALLEDQHWSQNRYYHKFLSQDLPTKCHSALEIGCGTSAFSRLLAKEIAKTIHEITRTNTKIVSCYLVWFRGSFFKHAK